MSHTVKAYQKSNVKHFLRGGSKAAATSKMELFVIIVNGFQLLTIITKCSILDVAAVLDPPLLSYPGVKHTHELATISFSYQLQIPPKTYRFLDLRNEQENNNSISINSLDQGMFYTILSCMTEMKEYFKSLPLLSCRETKGIYHFPNLK